MEQRAAWMIMEEAAVERAMLIHLEIITASYRILSEDGEELGYLSAFVGEASAPPVWRTSCSGGTERPVRGQEWSTVRARRSRRENSAGAQRSPRCAS